MKLTVFTPAYNRAEFLPRLYESLLQQVQGEFEWLVVDDGSSDNTEHMVQEFATENRVPIRYVKKKNGGKHTAHNLAVKEAVGEWFFCVDSDDFLAPSAICNILKALEVADHQVAGLVGYKEDSKGDLLCTRLPQGAAGGMYSLMNQFGGSGEYALLFRTDVLRTMPFPEIRGERFVTERVLYDRLELAGHTLCVLDKVLQVCEYQPDGLSSNSYRLMAQNPTGYQIYHAQRLDLVSSWKERLGHAVRYQAFSIMSKNERYRYRGKYRWLTELMYLPGAFSAYYYRNKAESI